MSRETRSFRVLDLREAQSREIRRAIVLGSGFRESLFREEPRETGPEARGERDRRWETATETKWGRALSQAAAPSPAWQLVHPDSLPAGSASAILNEFRPDVATFAAKNCEQRSKLSIERSSREIFPRAVFLRVLEAFSLTLFWCSKSLPLDLIFQYFNIHLVESRQIVH